MSVWFLNCFFYFQNLFVWFLKWFFWFPKFVRLISQMFFFWFPKFVRLISQRTLLISKICQFDFSNDVLISKICPFDFSKDTFDFQNLSVWFLKWCFDFQNLSVWFLEFHFWFPKFVGLISQMAFWFPKFVRLISQMVFWFPKFVRLISQMTLLISKILKWHWHPTVGGRRALLLCYKNIMAARNREGVFRGSCMNHPTYRFGACQKFVLMDGTWSERKVDWPNIERQMYKCHEPLASQLHFKRGLLKGHVHLYHNSSIMQISHRVLRNLEKMPSKKHKIRRSSFKNIRIEKYITPLASCLASRTPAFSIRH